jgi:hypothetical protein
LHTNNWPGQKELTENGAKWKGCQQIFIVAEERVNLSVMHKTQAGLFLSRGAEIKLPNGAGAEIRISAPDTAPALGRSFLFINGL